MPGKTDHALERLVFFSDAVFAIAITLLVIEIHAPHLEGADSDALHLQALAQLIPSFVGFAISFLVIGLFWMGHHRAFAMASRYSPRVLGWNLLLLMTIAFMPFVTAYSSSNLGDRVPTIFYCVALLIAALLNLKVNRVATSPPMVDVGVSAEEIASLRRRSLGVALGAASAVAVSLVYPPAATAALVTIPLWRLVLEAAARK